MIRLEEVLEVLPKTIKIGGLTYDVILVEDRNFESAKQNTGSGNIAYQKIWLEYGKRNIEGIIDDLLHELVEIIGVQCDLGLDHKTVSTLATMLHQVLRDSHLKI